MFYQWTSHLEKPEDKERFEQTIQSSKPTLDRLKTILLEQEEMIEREELNIHLYDNPNWAARQAFRNGQRKAVRELFKLVDLDQQKGIKIDPRLTQPTG